MTRPPQHPLKFKAHWVSQDTVLWNIHGSPDYTYSLFYSPDAALKPDAHSIHGGVEIPLARAGAGAGPELARKFPHLASYTAFKIDPADFDKIPAALKSELVIVAHDKGGRIVDMTGLQVPGALDALYPYCGPLGVTFSGKTPTLRLWAPTAKSVALNLFADAATDWAEKMPMKWDAATGVWSIEGNPDWAGKFYLYEVEVYMPCTSKIETNQATDPYSLSVSTNGKRSQVVDLDDAALKPQGWGSLAKPTSTTLSAGPEAPEDMVVYELHVRDFSISDKTVPENLRGTFRAFTVKESNGMKHLRALAAAGLTHIQLLPSFDFATVDEDKTTWLGVDEAALAALPPDSDGQANAVNAIKDRDGFNWGYDPFHYTVPEGSYATDPNGAGRALEFREMVQALNQAGLRVVMDVVYNHTFESGLNPKSVLDKAVPGYYYRRDGEGKVEKSTCCENTATEHAMMRKLMIDSVLTWARAYKVDGFRFDLMGHHMLDDMKALRAALDALTLEKDGVDGKAIALYGEGWNFGEVANNARGVNATQQNIDGTGIGVFNDRLRDAVRGGSAFGDLREQGFATGLLFAPNAHERRDAWQQKSRLFEYTDWLRLGLAGNLRDYPLIRASGETATGAQIPYGGSSAGYTLDPQENILYVAAHDNETLWDSIQVKAPASATLADRIRMNNLALSLVMFSQGVPFFHAGDDLLRSKSLDRDSYNSGDWFNKLDWSYESNNWGRGLPGRGHEHWDWFRSLLSNPALRPVKKDITHSAALFRELLQIRRSSPLFRLRTAGDVQKSVSFLNTGPNQIPGLIVLRLADSGNLDAPISTARPRSTGSISRPGFPVVSGKPPAAGKNSQNPSFRAESSRLRQRPSAGARSGNRAAPGCARIRSIAGPRSPGYCAPLPRPVRGKAMRRHKPC